VTATKSIVAAGDLADAYTPALLDGAMVFGRC
jgi:hypothetical protein